MYFLYDNITNGFQINVLNIVSVVSIYCSILVITSKNPVVSVLFLIALFFNVACYLILIGLNFIGLSYLLVYVGAVSILFLFILMLINIRISELLSQTRNSVPLVAIVSALIVISINSIIFNEQTSSIKGLIFSPKTNGIYNINDTINNTSSFNWDGNLVYSNPMASMGNIMFTSYPLWLIITSIILLLGMAGIIVITLSSNSNNSN